MSVIRRGMEYISRYGLAYTLRRLLEKTQERLFHPWHRIWLHNPLMQPEALESQRRNPPGAGLISVLIPVYNPNETFLKELLDSLRAQTYPDWEACLYNTGDSGAVRGMLEKAAAEDTRFRVVLDAPNLGISGNTNQALAMAQGEWIVLCDHDDALPPYALFCIAEEIAKDRANVIYTDEDKITENGRWHIEPHLKPDFSPDNLRSGNYICHLLAARRELVERIGGLRPETDGSQDHDLALRLSETTDRICHLPLVAYHWRAVRSSMSHRHLEKCLEAARRAVEEHTARIGWPAQVTVEHGILRLKYSLSPMSAAALVTGTSEPEIDRAAAELSGCLPAGTRVVKILCGSEDERVEQLNRAAAQVSEDLMLVVDASLHGFSEDFWEEMAMYAQRQDVGLVTPQLLDKRGRIAHAGFAVVGDSGVLCRNEGLPGAAAGWHLLNRQSHNVGAVSAACFMVRRAAWIPMDAAMSCAFAAVDLSLRMSQKGLHHVYTPHAKAQCTARNLLLPGKTRSPEDLKAFAEKWGGWQDPCWNPGFRTDRADFKVGGESR